MISRNRIQLASIIYLLLAISTTVNAEQWYLPRPTNVLKKGSAEFGSRVSFSFDRNGLEFNRLAQLGLSLRVNPVNRFEFYVEAPYSYIEQERVKFPSYIYSESQEGWGDIYTQFSFDIAGRQDWKVIFHTDASFPTGKNPYVHSRSLGSGFYSVAPGFTFLKVIDPVVMYLYLGRQWTFPEHFTNYGKIQPGGDLRFRVGSSIMLNPRVKINLFTVGNIIGHIRLNGVQIAGSDQDVLRFGGGLSWNVSDSFRVDWNAVFGATDNADDALLNLEFTQKF